MDQQDLQTFFRLGLAALAFGACVGFIVTGLIGKVLDVFERRWDRKWRIEAARNRDHGAVPRLPDPAP